jgi:hypothetical protein
MVLKYHHSKEQNDFLDKVGFITRLQDDEEDVVCGYLDFEQSTVDEKETLNQLVCLTMEMKHTNEWIDMDDSVEGLIYILLWDEHEMHKDMCEYEEEEMCHDLFANNHFDTRFPKNDFEISKRSEIDLEGKVTYVGPDFGTVDTVYGKVFIPKHLLTGDDIGYYADEICEHDFVHVRAQFKGLSGCRTEKKPWRAIAIKSDEGPDEWDCPNKVFRTNIGGHTFRAFVCVSWPLPWRAVPRKFDDLTCWQRSLGV